MVNSHFRIFGDVSNSAKTDFNNNVSPHCFSDISPEEKRLFNLTCPLWRFGKDHNNSWNCTEPEHFWWFSLRKKRPKNSLMCLSEFQKICQTAHRFTKMDFNIYFSHLIFPSLNHLCYPHSFYFSFSHFYPFSFFFFIFSLLMN